jgi:hypothetical protein
MRAGVTFPVPLSSLRERVFFGYPFSPRLGREGRRGFSHHPPSNLPQALYLPGPSCRRYLGPLHSCAISFFWPFSLLRSISIYVLDDAGTGVISCALDQLYYSCGELLT